MKLSIIVPVYDERETIGPIIKKVLKSPYLKELIIVDDGSKDGTREFLKQNIEGQDQIKVLYHDKNRGKTAAIRSALSHVSGDIVIIQDADLEYSPSDYPLLIEPIISGEADVVYGSRFLNKSRMLFIWQWLLYKCFGMNYELKELSHFLGIHFLNVLASLLYGIRISDIATGYKVFRSKIITEIPLETDRFEFCYEITAKIAKKKIRIKEVSIDYHPRTNLRGKKIRWVDGIWASWALIKYRFRR